MNYTATSFAALPVPTSAAGQPRRVGFELEFLALIWRAHPMLWRTLWAVICIARVLQSTKSPCPGSAPLLSKLIGHSSNATPRPRVRVSTSG